MTTKIYDKTVFEEKADFTLSVAIPESSYAVKNPDGTQPVVTLKVDATTNRFALGVLAQMNESGMIQDIVAGSILGTTEEELDKMIRKNPKKVLAKLSEIHEPFATVSFEASDEDGNTITIALTAPSGIIAIRAFTAITTDQKLNALAVTFMPDERDADDYWDDEG